MPHQRHRGRRRPAGRSRGLRAAVERASKCTDVEKSDAASPPPAPRFYAFNKVSKQPFENAQGLDSREAALEAVDEKDRANAEILEVPEGVLVIRDEKGPVGEDGKEPPDPGPLVGDPGPARRSRAPTSRTPSRTSTSSGGGEPIVTFDFTDKGRKAFQDITRRIAQRGVGQHAARACPADQASQHFAIVLDDELVSAPFINFQENPDGIDGSTGAQISGGFTITSAQDLAKILQIGALPIKLELISRSQVSASLGAQALDQGLAAGIAGLAIVALFLIVFYRVLGLIASARAADLRAVLLRAGQGGPGHADAAGHRGPDPHARRRRGREHRHLRARQGGGARRQRGLGARSSPATARA